MNKNEPDASGIYLEVDILRSALMSVFRCMPATARSRALALMSQHSVQRQEMLEEAPIPGADRLRQRTQEVEAKLYRALQEAHRLENQLGA